MERETLRHQIFSVSNRKEFNDLAVKIFHYQYKGNSIYHQFVDGLKKDPSDINSIREIPFLPVSFFKTHKVVTGDYPEQLVFESSGTTGMVPARHYIADPGLYEESFTRGFEMFYNSLKDYNIFALLPSYLERGNSSLVYMIEKLRWKSNQLFGGFYLNELDSLVLHLNEARDAGNKIILFGVSYALLDLVEKFSLNLQDALIFETGGMKGRRSELTRMELHNSLMQGFGVGSIHSEYGMTELLSQAWSGGEGIYHCPPWMQIMISDPNDPISLLDQGVSGGINIIDLANIDSCSFLATQDLGKVYNDGSFEVLGRFDASDIRGCSLLIA
ncbi:MAG: acyl transferase [Bacteroidales bacterium]|nr:acyl transferase [Bacteroidales bacterium]